MSRATFYVYFASKEDVFRILAEDVRDRFLTSQELTGIDAEDPLGGRDAPLIFAQYLVRQRQIMDAVVRSGLR